jgi:6-phosphofructokinase 1
MVKRFERGTGGRSPFYLKGPGGLYEYTDKRFKENGHMVIVISEG